MGREALAFVLAAGVERLAAAGGEIRAAVAVSLNPSARPFASATLDGQVELADLFAAIGPSLYVRVFETATGEAGRIFHAVEP